MAIVEGLKGLLRQSLLPDTAKQQLRADRRGLPSRDPGCEAVITEGAGWLGRAQDYSASCDGGVARDFSLLSGWASSYPETTGYIIPTMIAYGRRSQDNDALKRARRMLDWCSAIQLDGGAYQGGRIDANPIVPVTFNTGQVLIGLAHGVIEFGNEYYAPMIASANWLRDTIDSDGCWRRHPTPFASPGEKTYETHVAWGLLEAERVAPGMGYQEAALKNVRWAITKQQPNGWFAECCLDDPSEPLTHTIGYALRGVIEAFRFSKDHMFLESARRTAEALVQVIEGDGSLAGRFDAEWKPTVPWVCLTGSSQIALCLFRLFQYTRHTPYREKAYALNQFVRRTVSISGSDGVRGGVKGAFPVNGDYGAFEYLSWAVKFTLDAQMLESRIRLGELDDSKT